KAITHLHGRYAHLLVGLCYKYLGDMDTAKDATQQIFIKLLSDLNRFEIQSFKPWLYQVARNHCLMIIRKNGQHKTVEFQGMADVESDEDFHRRVEKEKLYVKMEAAINSLANEQRECIQLFYFKKMTYAEIVEKTGLDYMKVKSAIQNGKRNL